MNEYQAGDVIVVPFPFTDLAIAKKRPAVVLSSGDFVGRTNNVLCAMITTAGNSSWPFDVSIRDLANVGLSQPCVIRQKLFTLDTRLVLKHKGQLGKYDFQNLSKAFKQSMKDIL